VLSCSFHIRLWDIDSGKCIQTFEGHNETVRTVEWSADQRFVLSAGHDCTVRVWDVESGSCVKVFEGHPTLVVCASWCPGQRQIVSCDENAGIRFWDWGR